MIKIKILLILLIIALVIKIYKHCKKNITKRIYKRYKDSNNYYSPSTIDKINLYYSSPVYSGEKIIKNKHQKTESLPIEKIKINSESPTKNIAKIPKIIREKEKILENVKYKEDYTFSGTKRKIILTNNELKFYLKLKSIAEIYNFTVFPNMRVADLIDTASFGEFQKLSSRHIDFTIVDKYTRPLLYIELDDPTHYKWKQKERDMKKDYIFKVVNEYIIRVKLCEVDKKLSDINEYLKYKFENEY